MGRVAIVLLWVMSLTWSNRVLAQPQIFTLGVSEGSSGSLDHMQAVAKYQGFAELISRALKSKVNIVFSRGFEQLEDGMKTGRLDFVLARPSDYPARGMRDHGYNFVASAKPDGHCLILVPKGSTLQSLNDIKGKKIVFPEEISYMARFCAAELRTQGIVVAKEKVQFVRDQAAIAYFLDNRLVDVGAVASYSGVAKKLEKDGNRILHRSVAQPFFPMVANRRISAEQIKAIRTEMLALTASDAGKEILKTIGVDQFDTSAEPKMRELLQWLKI